MVERGVVELPHFLVKVIFCGWFWDRLVLGILPTDFILDTKVQPIEAYLMVEVTVNLTEGQGHS